MSELLRRGIGLAEGLLPWPSTRALFRRWCAFNLVGFLGIGVQMLVLAVLHGWLQLHYLASTALAVETAIAHNFWWHERWTWADRSAHSIQESMARLARFNLTNGVISIVSNLVLMKLFVEGLRIPYLAANLLSITLCSIANFLASDRYVFRGGQYASDSRDEGPGSEAGLKTRKPCINHTGEIH